MSLIAGRADAIPYFNGYSVNGISYGYDNPSGRFDYSIDLNANFMTVGSEGGGLVLLLVEEDMSDSETSIDRLIRLTAVPPPNQPMGKTLIFFTGQTNPDYANANFEITSDDGLKIIRWDVDPDGQNDVFFAGFQMDLSDPDDLVRTFSYTVDHGIVPPNAPFLGMQGATGFISVPEPGTALLLGMALASASLGRRRRWA